MILGLDIGNTSIVVGGLDESAIHFTAEFSTDPYKTSDEYAIMLKTVLEIHEIDRKGLEGAIIGTVVPALGEVHAGSSAEGDRTQSPSCRFWAENGA